MKKSIIYILSFSIIMTHVPMYAYGNTSSTDMTFSIKDLLGYNYDELSYQDKEQTLDGLLDTFTEARNALSVGEDIDLETASILLLNIEDESQIPPEHHLAGLMIYERARFLNLAHHRIEFLRKVGFQLDRLDLQLIGNFYINDEMRADLFREIDAQMFEEKPLNKSSITLKLYNTKKRMLSILQAEEMRLQRQIARSRIWERFKLIAYGVLLITVFTLLYRNDENFSREVNDILRSIKPMTLNILDQLIEKINEMRDALAEESESQQSRPEF